MTKVYLSIPSLWSFRNFVYSDLIEDLKMKYHFILLVPKGSNYLNVIENLGYNYIEYPVNIYSTKERFFIKALNYRLVRKNRVLRNSKLVLHTQGVSSTIKERGLKLIAQLISFIFSSKVLFNFYRISSKDNRLEDIVKEIAKSPKAIIIATNIVVKHELILFLQFTKLKNKKIDFINSFDNTTSRGYMPFEIFDRHIVWNNNMAQELIDIFGESKNKIEILGTPQFDLLTLGGKTKLKTDDPQFNIVENSKYILYCAGHHSLIPFEKKIVTEMIQELNKSFDDLKFIIRLHPLDNWNRWTEQEDFPSNVMIDYPWKQNSTNPLMSLPGKYEYLRHGRLLNNAMLILNIGSTTSLDACVLNRPVYNICFDSFNKNGELDMIYNSEHYSPIIASKSAPLVNNIIQLVEVISGLVRDSEPKDMSLKRRSFAKEYCGYKESSIFTIRFDDFLKNSLSSQR